MRQRQTRVGYRKSDIVFHERESGWKRYPAVNVKIRSSFYDLVWRNVTGMSDADVQKLAARVWEVQSEQFWYTTVPDLAWQAWGETQITYEQAGKSGGWLVVTSIYDEAGVIEYWSGIEVARWGKFCRLVERELTALQSDAVIRGTIEAIVNVV